MYFFCGTFSYVSVNIFYQNFMLNFNYHFFSRNFIISTYIRKRKIQSGVVYVVDDSKKYLIYFSFRNDRKIQNAFCGK